MSGVSGNTGNSISRSSDMSAVNKEAVAFAKKWQDKGDEKQDSQNFWRELLSRVFGIDQRYGKSKWNSIVNKPPISASSNREIGRVAPCVYLGKLEKKGAVLTSDLDGYVETHLIDHTLLRNNEFQDFIVDRAKKLLCAIESATGRTISGKDSDEVQQAFGASLN